MCPQIFMSKAMKIANAVAAHMTSEMKKGKPKKYSDEAEETISDKMDIIKNEDRPQKQKVAIAINEARQKGLKVPKKA